MVMIAGCSSSSGSGAPGATNDAGSDDPFVICPPIATRAACTANAKCGYCYTTAKCTGRSFATGTDHVTTSELCSTVKDGAECDKDDVRCGNDFHSVFRCVNGKFTPAFSCPTGQLCALSDRHDAVSCGSGSFRVTLAQEGWPCGGDGSGACSADQTMGLGCQRGVWTKVLSCAGVCGSDGNQIVCK